MGKAGGHPVATARGVVPGTLEDGSRATADAVLDTLRKVLRYWWVVLAVIVLCVLGAVFTTARTPTTYTARASLIVASNDRAPEQDAVLVQGYVTYFNDPAYQSQLLSAAKVGDGVSIEARAAAASPILLVDATTSDARSAQKSAATVAQTFRKAINRVRSQQNTAEVADLREKINEIRASGDTSDTARSQVTELQDRILQLQADRVNMLQELQLNAGVTQNSPRLTTNVGFAVLGGLLLGTLGALAAAAAFSRLRKDDEQATLGLRSLAEIPNHGALDDEQRREKFRQLAAEVTTSLSHSAVLAITAPGPGSGAAIVASGLARELAEQGMSTLLVRASGSPRVSMTSPATRVGDRRTVGFDSLFGHALAEALAPWLRVGPAERMWVIEPVVSPAGSDLEVPADSLYELLAHSGGTEAVIILEAPAIVGSADAQVLCAASGGTILVIDTATTHASQSAAAVSILEQLDSGLLGAVFLVDHQEPGTDHRSKSRGEGSGLESIADREESSQSAIRRNGLAPDDGRGSSPLARALRTRSVGTGER